MRKIKAALPAAAPGTLCRRNFKKGFTAGEYSNKIKYQRLIYRSRKRL